MKGIKQPIFEDTWNIKIEKESMKPQIEDIWNIKMKTSQWNLRLKTSGKLE